MAAIKARATRTRSIALHKVSRKNDRLEKKKEWRRRLFLWLRQAWRKDHGVSLGHGCMPSDFLRKMLGDDGRRSPVNSFVVLMFIHLNPSETPQPGQTHPTMTPRRVLLDSGADFNLISHGAHAELNLTKQPFEGVVRSIGGYTMFNGTVHLQWHFRSPTSSSRHSFLLHRAPFHVLPADANAKFDCIIGCRWIIENWSEFVALVEMNLQMAILAPCGPAT
ncbi:hypothetical protein A1O3_06557 [Capronia epimyces CBS 606.96]|uniref:Peptidase A2 domain-containing protein n=1 Tax=Capronia epimyces CBS 606.96 TaxID=1182542 RepID=W9XQB3_9EURO|nr:uncharacterized protein A1O3_06557 [Capronia epimyces CBS 606.96]EXJ82742.1 hypothetical protein A1O3_06557 [Capronia epimyces CBS 606.96]